MNSSRQDTISDERRWSMRATCGVLNLAIVGAWAWVADTAFEYPVWPAVAGLGMMLSGLAMKAQLVAAERGE